MTTFDTLLYEVSDGLCRLTLNRPENMNGMTNQMVREARDALEKAGFDASGHVIGTRRAAKRILEESRRFGADAIVMGADRHRGVLSDFIWSQEPHRVARRARVPVYLVPLDEG